MLRLIILNFFVILSVFPFLTQAAFELDMTEKTQVTINDLMLMPEKGKFWGETGIINGEDSFRLTFLSFDYLKKEKKISGFYQLLSYSFSDRFRAGINLVQIQEERETDTYGAASGIANGIILNYKSSGLKDPEYFLRYRAIKQQDNEGKIDLDLQLLLSPKSEDAKTATPRAEGNVARGGSATQLMASVGRKFNSLQFAFAGSLESYSRATYKDAETGLEFAEQEPFSIFELSSGIQLLLNEKWLLNGGFAISKIPTMTYTNKQTGIMTVYSSTTRTSIGLGVLFSPIPEKLSLGLSTIVQSMKDRDVFINRVPLKLTDIEGRSTTIFLRYLL